MLTGVIDPAGGAAGSWQRDRDTFVSMKTPPLGAAASPSASMIALLRPESSALGVFDMARMRRVLRRSISPIRYAIEADFDSRVESRKSYSARAAV